MFYIPFFLLIVTLASHVFSHELPPVVQSKLGNIQGHYKKSFSGRQYAAYEGIPYAVPPTGPRRFQPAELKEFVGNLNATKEGNKCVQYYGGDNVQGNEDCLYLNIYVPVLKNKKQLPVLFAIHGGAFQLGSGFTGVDYLLDKDVIVVSINYRLGIFGFLSTQDHVVPGNMGLKDQSLALKWVSRNIHFFGGNPRKVTLLGQSAGAASVHYHYLSKMSRGLFQNGVSFSGNSMGPGKQNEHSRELAIKVASLVGCPTQNITKMVECLRTKPAKSIAVTLQRFQPWRGNPVIIFGPVVEKNSDKPFIDRSPIEIISSGGSADVLWVSTAVSDEGLYPGGAYVDNDEILKDLDKNWANIAPYLLEYNYTIPLAQHAEVANKIRQYYFGDKAINRGTDRELIACITDRLYKVAFEFSAKVMAKAHKSPVLLGYYTYRAQKDGSHNSNSSIKDYGVGHGDDFGLVFRFGNPPKNKEDREMQIRLVDFVTAVAETGYPDMGLKTEWKKLNPNQDSTEYLHFINPQKIVMERYDNFGHKNFWRSINFNENKLH